MNISMHNIKCVCLDSCFLQEGMKRSEFPIPAHFPPKPKSCCDCRYVRNCVNQQNEFSLSVQLQQNHPSYFLINRCCFPALNMDSW